MGCARPAWGVSTRARTAGVPLLREREVARARGSENVRTGPARLRPQGGLARGAGTAEHAGPPPRSATEAVGGPGSDCGCPPRWEWPGRDRAPQGQASCWPPPSLPVFSPVSSHKTGRAGVSCRPPSCVRGAPMLPVLVSRCSQEHVARHGEKRTALEPDKSGDKPPCACKGEKALFFPVRPSQHGKASRPPPLPLPQIPLPHVLLPPHPRKSGSKPRPSLGHA